MGDMYKPTGELQGDDRAMPDRGTASGVTDTYGADLSLKAINRKGRFNAVSDMPFDSSPGDEGQRGDRD